jgi:uncharacterized membrane protein YjjP (DUF1212 family)
VAIQVTDISTLTIMQAADKPSQTELGELLLEMGALLMASGANTARIKITVDRIASAFGCFAELLVTHHALMMTLTYPDNHKVFTSVKWVPGMHLNFNLIADISTMSWQIVLEKWPVERISQELLTLNRKPLYPRALVLLLVALAGAAFCRLFGGNLTEMVAAFVASFCGLYVRQEAIKLKFNFYVAIFFASATASLVAGSYFYFHPAEVYSHAFSTSVLFLIPGVPMIHAISDLLDGNTINGVTRGVNVLIMAFAIALGLMVALLAYKF